MQDEELPALRLTYPEVEGTRRPVLPAGYRHAERSTVLGLGRPVFDRAAEALLTWQVQRGAGLRVRADADRAREGSTVLLGVGLGPLRQQAPCRVVYTLAGDRLAGFAYGTLEGHPEQGEELFAIRLDDDERVRFTIRAFSRPATALARLGGPAAVAVQEWITWRYLRAARRLAVPEPPPVQDHR